MEFESIGKRLKHLRKKNKLTLAETGRQVSISKQTLYKYENGIITNIPVNKIENLAKLYQVPPAFLMGWCSCAEVPSHQENKSGNTTREEKIIEKYRALDERGKKAVEVMLDSQYESVYPEINVGDEVS